MAKSLGDYNIEQSSSANIKNIKWTKRNPTDTEKSKKKTAKKTSPTNIIYNHEIKKSKPPVEKIFKVENVKDSEKSKNKKTKKRVQNASAVKCKIKPGFKRPAR